MTRYRPPRDCPVCSARLQVTQLGCPNCGTGLTGAFESCEFCGLDQADRDLLRVFLASRGNMKELERHLGVSYPTARARFEDLLRKLGLAAGAGTGAGTAAGSGAASAPAPAGQNGGTAGTMTARSTSATAGPGARAAAGDPRLEMLRAVAAGTVDVAEASDVLGGPTPPAPSPPAS